MKESFLFSEITTLRKGYGLLLKEIFLHVKHSLMRARWHKWYRSIDQLPDKVHNILFLCKGNICRSPLAEVYLRSKLRPELGITVRSAGLDTTDGKPAHQLSKLVAEQHGLNLSCHQTTLMARELVEEADLILVMEFSQLVTVLRLCPKLEGKVFVLSQFNEDNQADITDPFSGNADDFNKCFQVIRASCDSLVKRLTRSISSSQSVLCHDIPQRPSER